MNDKALTMITTFDHTYLFFDKKKKTTFLLYSFQDDPWIQDKQDYRIRNWSIIPKQTSSSSSFASSFATSFETSIYGG